MARVPAQRNVNRTPILGIHPVVRSNALRFWMLVGVVVIEAISFGIAVSGFFPESARNASGADFWGPLGEAVGMAALVLLAVHLVVFAFLAPLVSYRWFDTFFLLVPIVSVVFWFRVVWRVTALPQRYWPARDSELPAHPRPRDYDSAADEDARAWH
jgi:hypothetical protein